MKETNEARAARKAAYLSDPEILRLRKEQSKRDKERAAYLKAHPIPYSRKSWLETWELNEAMNRHEAAVRRPGKRRWAARNSTGITSSIRKFTDAYPTRSQRKTPIGIS